MDFYFYWFSVFRFRKDFRHCFDYCWVYLQRSFDLDCRLSIKKDLNHCYLGSDSSNFAYYEHCFWLACSPLNFFRMNSQKDYPLSCFGPTSYSLHSHRQMGSLMEYFSTPYYQSFQSQKGFTVEEFSHLSFVLL